MLIPRRRSLPPGVAARSLAIADALRAGAIAEEARRKHKAEEPKLSGGASRGEPPALTPLALNLRGVSLSDRRRGWSM